MAKCKPHKWRMPKVGDDALECEACGRKLLYGQITPNMRASIVNGYERRMGDCNSGVEEFRAALYETEENARARGFPAIPERALPRRERSALETVLDPSPRPPGGWFPKRALPRRVQGGAA